MDIPIVSLDKIYVNIDDNKIYFLDCTRINGTNKIISRNKEKIDIQIERISNTVSCTEIVLLDDVIFSGNVLKFIIEKFNNNGIKVNGVISSICTMNAYNYFNKNLKNGIKCNYLLGDKVIDQICERDFYFGIAGSGIMVNTEKGLCKAPYFYPYGDPQERASIPSEYSRFFSKKCLERSIDLWEEIDSKKDNNTLIRDLPEKIVNTEEKEEVVKTLRKELKRL